MAALVYTQVLPDGKRKEYLTELSDIVRWRTIALACAKPVGRPRIRGKTAAPPESSGRQVAGDDAQRAQHRGAEPTLAAGRSDGTTRTISANGGGTVGDSGDFDEREARNSSCSNCVTIFTRTP